MNLFSLSNIVLIITVFSFFIVFFSFHISKYISDGMQRRVLTYFFSVLFLPGKEWLCQVQKGNIYNVQNLFKWECVWLNLSNDSVKCFWYILGRVQKVGHTTDFTATTKLFIFKHDKTSLVFFSVNESAPKAIINYLLKTVCCWQDPFWVNQRGPTKVWISRLVWKGMKSHEM